MQTPQTFINISIGLLVLLCGVFLFNSTRTNAPYQNSIPVSNENETAISNLVVEFGATLKNVSLLQPAADLKVQMESQYGKYVAPELLARWEADPSVALGRAVSSPWPDHIDVVSVIKQTQNSYKVEGNVIEVTSADGPNIPAAVYPVSLVVEKRGTAWLIVDSHKGAYSELPKRITITGVWECLPHTNSSGPQTDECALGVAGDQSDAHYAIDTHLIQTQPVNFSTGAHVKVEGIFMPANQLSSDAWKKYPIDGIISATSIQQI